LLIANRQLPPREARRAVQARILRPPAASSADRPTSSIPAPMRITVLMGGTSAERDVSLATGLRVTEALRTRGHAVTVVDTVRGALSAAEERTLVEAGTVKSTPPSPEAVVRMTRAGFSSLMRSIPQPGSTDCVFMALHGGSGEDGTIQSLLDITGLPYTGSGRLASALAMDKDLSKHLFRAEGVRTADWMMAERPARGEAPRPSPEFLEQALDTLGLPLIVKPSKQGSTVGLSVVKEAGELPAAIAEAFKYDDEVMVERFIAGRELCVGILGHDALPVGEIIPQHEIYDYECKYTAGMATEVFPAEIPDAVRDEVQRQGLAAFRALKLRGCARLDFRLDAAGDVWCLEANTLPGMTATSLVPQAAAAAGMDFPTLCERIVELAIEMQSVVDGRTH
jgi:D-alanine-D-alanine ligase